MDAFNKIGKGTIKVTFFQNDPYKAKIRTAVGAGQAPTLIFGWGGGILKSYADAGQVDDLTSWLNENLPSRTSSCHRRGRAATIDKKIYAVPITTTAPIVMYYNKTLFDKAGAQPPATWDDVMKLVDVFNAAGRGAVRPRRPVEVDLDDVAGVSARPDRRSRGVRRDLRQ